MSHSSSGLRGVTLNDLFVVTAKRATDMRSLAEPVHEKEITPKPDEPTSGYYVLNALFHCMAHFSLFVGTYTLSAFVLPYAQKNIEAVGNLVAHQGLELVRVALAGMVWITLQILLGETFSSALKKGFPTAPKKSADGAKGYVARVSLPHAAISPGTLKVAYSVTPDALVIRSLKDHAITVISMEMICRVFVGDLAVFSDQRSDDPTLVSGCGHSHNGDRDCCGKFDPKAELALLKISSTDDLYSWYGPGGTEPVIVSLKSGDTKIPLIIHGLYFDRLASAKGANKKFVEEFNAALCAFRKSQAGHGDHGHDDQGHGGHGGHGH